MSGGLDRKTESIIGIVFLVGMIITFIVAITTFEGTPTILLILLAVVFLAVALFFLSGSSSSGRGGGDGGQSQQQSIVLGGGEGKPMTLSQSSSGVMVVCRHCGGRAPESAAFCPECGRSVAG